MIRIRLDPYRNRRGARVVDWAPLLRECAFTGTEGSNPSLSADLNNVKIKERASAFLHSRGGFERRSFI